MVGLVDVRLAILASGRTAGIRRRALLRTTLSAHLAATLIRASTKQMLGDKTGNGWTPEKCQQRNHSLKSAPQPHVHKPCLLLTFI